MHLPFYLFLASEKDPDLCIKYRLKKPKPEKRDKVPSEKKEKQHSSSKDDVSDLFEGSFICLFHFFFPFVFIFFKHTKKLKQFWQDECLCSLQSERKRSRRTCGECVACVRTEDCGQCDFCKVLSVLLNRIFYKMKPLLEKVLFEFSETFLPYISSWSAPKFGKRRN